MNSNDKLPASAVAEIRIRESAFPPRTPPAAPDCLQSVFQAETKVQQVLIQCQRQLLGNLSLKEMTLKEMTYIEIHFTIG